MDQKKKKKKKEKREEREIMENAFEWFSMREKMKRAFENAIAIDELKRSRRDWNNVSFFIPLLNG